VAETGAGDDNAAITVVDHRVDHVGFHVRVVVHNTDAVVEHGLYTHVAVGAALFVIRRANI
jgi:hypothetical protein